MYCHALLTVSIERFRTIMVICFFFSCVRYTFLYFKKNEALYLENERLNQLVTDLEVTLRKCQYKYNVVDSCDSKEAD